MIGHLRDVWTDTRVNPGDSLNIVGVFPEPWVPGGPLHLVADMDKGLVVLHPDVLLSGVDLDGTKERVVRTRNWQGGEGARRGRHKRVVGVLEPAFLLHFAGLFPPRLPPRPQARASLQP